MTELEGALSDERFAQAMAHLGPFEAFPHLAVALSGGPDSLALLALASHWCAQRGGRVTALTVDHGLRPESAAEAMRASLLAQDLGAGHVRLEWTGQKPRSGLQAAARAARYRLMTEWCRAAGVLHLATAHQADDQRETVAMRRARSADPLAVLPGHAGMSAVAPLAGVRLVRPLLGVSRASILRYLDANRLQAVDDPSNRAERFERVRWRLGQMGTLPRLEDVAASGRTRSRLEMEAADFLMRGAHIAPAGHVLIAPDVMATSSPEVVALALGQVLVMVGGRNYRPAREALQRDLAAIREGSGARSLGGCLIVRHRDRILVCREAAGAAAGIRIAGRGSYFWDRRFHVQCGRLPDTPGPLPLEIGALGENGLLELAETGESAALLAPIPAPARPALPAFRDATGRLIQVPFTHFDPFGLEAALLCRFRPYNSATSSGFTVARAVPHTI